MGIKAIVVLANEPLHEQFYQHLVSTDLNQKFIRHTLARDISSISKDAVYFVDEADYVVTKQLMRWTEQ